MSRKLLIYTREPLDTNIYDAKLAYSMHLAFKDGDECIPLNHNSGVFFAKATTEGVVRFPSALGMTTGSPPSKTATQELVVPRSIPIILAIIRILLL